MFVDENGFVYMNDYVCEYDDMPIQEEEATDYINWCRYYGVDMSDADNSKKAARLAKKEARENSKIEEEMEKKFIDLLPNYKRAFNGDVKKANAAIKEFLKQKYGEEMFKRWERKRNAKAQKLLRKAQGKSKNSNYEDFSFDLDDAIEKYNAMTDEEKEEYSKKVKRSMIISYIFTGVIAVVVIIFAIALIKKRKK